MGENLDQLTGFMTETTTQSQLYNASYSNKRIGYIIDILLSKSILFNSGVKKIEIKPKYAKKSIKVSEKSERCAETGPKTTCGSPKNSITVPAPTSIVTEQGICITLGSNITSTPIGPL